MAFSTPRTGHLSEDGFESVYEPAEDSFLFLDAIQQDWDSIIRLRPTICLEIGCGSGIVSTFVSRNLSKNAKCFMLCVDINPCALSSTRRTFGNNLQQRTGVLDVILGDLATALLPVSSRTIDLILFNPPYVVTSSEELKTGDLASKAWAGGERGRQVMDRFFPQAATLLSPNGIMYCIAIRENNIDDITEMVKAYGLKTEIVCSRRCKNELLHVLRLAKQKVT